MTSLWSQRAEQKLGYVDCYALQNIHRYTTRADREGKIPPVNIKGAVDELFVRNVIAFLINVILYGR